MSKEQVAFLTGTQVGNKLSIVFPHVYGSFSSTQTQPIPTGSAVMLTYDTVDIAGGGLILGGGLPSPFINVSSAGVYRVITSVQLNKQAGGGSSGDVYMWFSVDGVAVPNSATKYAVTNTFEACLTVEVMVSLTSGQRISVMATATNGGEEILAEPPILPNASAVPSIITIVQRVV